MLKRAWLSVTRRRAKTIILLGLLFIIANLVLASFTIKKATDEAMVFARKSLGSEVVLAVDMEKLRAELETSGWDPRMGMHPLREKMLSVNARVDDVETLSKSSFVVDVKYGFICVVNPVGFDIFDIASRTVNYGPGGGRGRNDLVIEAINSFELLPAYRNKEIYLLEGTAFNENDVDKIIISYDIALENDFKIGDKLKVVNSEGKEVEYTIGGIFENKSKDEYTNNYNTMFVNIDSGIKILTKDEYNNGKYKLNNSAFYLNDPISIEKFIEEAKTMIPDLETRYLLLDANSATYKTMIDPIKKVGGFADTIKWIVVIASIVILSLIVVNSVKERNYELGVLLALGEKKVRIMGQFIFELLIITSIAFSLSIATSAFVSNSIGDKMLESQLEMSNNQTQVSMGGRGGMFGRFNPSMYSNGEPIDKIDISVDASDIIKLFMIGYLIILGSSVIPSTTILKSDPKSILSRKDG